MVFCPNCGRSIKGGRFCPACGGPIAPDAVDAIATKLKRHRNQMLLTAVALGLVFAVTGWVFLSRVMRAGRTASPTPAIGESFAPVTRQQPLPVPPSAQIPLGQPSPQPSPAIVSEESGQASRPSPDSTRPKDVQNAITSLTQKDKQRETSLQQLPASSGLSTGSDRYPGSEPIEVNANLPDIGVPVTSEVYTTTDSVSTVVAYYTQRYSDAEVTEVNGQKIIAVDRPGATRVIAIGTTGEETRIAIIKQAN
jgi:hypothetical protein